MLTSTKAFLCVSLIWVYSYKRVLPSGDEILDCGLPPIVAYILCVRLYMTLWYLLISMCVIFMISTQSLMCSHQTTSAYYIFFFNVWQQKWCSVVLWHPRQAAGLWIRQCSMSNHWQCCPLVVITEQHLWKWGKLENPSVFKMLNLF